MSQKSFAQLFRRWVARGSRRAGGPQPTRLRLEEVEDRLVPATTPPVTATAAVTVPNSTGAAFAPQVVADPTNPNTLAMAVAETNGVLIQISFDSGTSWAVIRNTIPTVNDPSGGKLLDPNLPVNAGIPQINRSYTNDSAPTIAFTRSGSIYVAYLEHNAAMTSGALVVERFDVNRANESITQYDLDPARDWDNDPSTPASQRWTQANGQNNMAAVLYQWVDDGVTVNRPENPYIAVDTNLPTYTDPVTGQTVTDQFASGPGGGPGGGDTIFVAWNMQSTAPTINGGQFVNAVGQLGYTPNAIMLAVGRVDPLALIDRPDPNSPVGPTNQRTAAFEFSTPVPVNDGNGLGGTTSGGFFGAAPAPNGLATGGSAPIISFVPAAMNNGFVTPGALTITWATDSNQIITSAADLGAGPASASYTFRTNNNPAPSSGGFFGDIADGTAPPSGAPANTPDSAGVTTYDLPVDLTPYTTAQGGSFTTLSDLDLTLAISAPRLQDLQIQLIAPDGTAITLVQNRIDGLGNTRVSGGGVTAGLTGSDLGVVQGVQGTFANNPRAVSGNAVGTTFSDEAARQINDPNNPANDVGSFSPESGSLASFYGRTAAGLDSLPGANWQLRITDVRSDRLTFNNNPDFPVQFLRFFSLTFTSQLDNSNANGRLGTDNVAVFPNPISGALTPVTTVANAPVQTFPTTAPASPTFGIGPGVSVAFDNSLGSFSRFDGRLYAVYTGGSGSNTNIFLISSDDGGRLWTQPVQVNDDSINDNVSEGNRSQFQPVVTVDQATGTVVVMWYDARTDANNSRVSTFIATSIDGGETFSVNASVSPEKTAVDAITGKTVNLEPVPTNFSGFTTLNAGAFQYGGPGVRQALVAYDGVIHPFWTGNLNAAGSSIFTANVVTAAGPRVTTSDMGAVSGDSVDTDESGAQIQNGTIQVRDEENIATTITDAFGNIRTQYNDTFAPDGTRLIDGFRVVFDRPIYFGTVVTAGGQTLNVLDAANGGFGPDDVTVRYRGTSGNIDTGTQGALVPVQGVVPIGGETFTVNGTTYILATAFFVQFSTPQSAVGTYSYAVSPTVSDGIQSQNTAVFKSADTPVTIAGLSTSTSQIIVPPLGGSPTVQNLQVALNITYPFLSDLTVSLIHDPDGDGPLPATTIMLFDEEGGGQKNIVNMRLADGGIPSPYPITNPFNNFNGVYAPLDPLATFNGQSISGTWTLQVDDPFDDMSGTIDSWSLKFRDGSGNPVTIGRNGNGLDQNANGIQLEPQKDTYTAPGSTTGTPFSGPYDSGTAPLIEPGPNVVATYPGGQQAVATGVVIDNFSPNFLDVTLARPVDASTLTLNGIASVMGPNGPLTPVAVLPTNVLSGSTTTFILTFASGALPASGTFSVALNNRVYVTDGTVLDGTTDEVFVRFDRDINPASFAPANVLQITGPSGPLSLSGVTVTPVAEDRTPLPTGTTAARLFRVTFDQPELVTTQAAAFHSLPITLVGVPTTRPLTIADVLQVVGPTGKVDLTAATLTGSGTGYTLTFPVSLPAGQYTVDFKPTLTDLQTTHATATTTIGFTLAAAPPAGPLTMGGIASVVGPSGAVSLTGVTLSGSGTSYTLTFPTAPPAGQYTINLNPAAVRGVAVV
ncbi:MAG TPA: proprotein convertase P-domain-containing protein, partial [Urbifossiella sp.]|nr:proprotein convertase P-domain-containing protein [Urbifossiella sp.]